MIAPDKWWCCSSIEYPDIYRKESLFPYWLCWVFSSIAKRLLLVRKLRWWLRWFSGLWTYWISSFYVVSMVSMVVSMYGTIYWKLGSMWGCIYTYNIDSITKLNKHYNYTLFVQEMLGCKSPPCWKGVDCMLAVRRVDGHSHSGGVHYGWSELLFLLGDSPGDDNTSGSHGKWISSTEGMTLHSSLSQ